MMETLAQASYNPHLKKVLKTYQLSAVKSLQGPSTVLVRGAGAKEAEADEDGKPAPVVAPRSPPILTEPDRSQGERSETVLEGESISCFVVGGERRLCLPHILNSVLRDFSLQQINQVCDELQIFCSRCNPEQLEELKVSGILPTTAPSCGLITKTDAERLVGALLHRTAPPAPPRQEAVVRIAVYHECFGKCRGACLPDLYTESTARCIECSECRGLFAPQTFVCHVHRRPENRTCHWGFDSSNWRAYLLPVEGQPDERRRHEMLRSFKRRFADADAAPELKRKQMLMRTHRKKEYEDRVPECVLPLEESACKRAKLDDPAAASVYLAQAQYDAFQYYSWYESWARNVSAFRPWPSLSKDHKHMPPYLSHDPPVLLHPERVVPMSQCEQFESTFQPNVALAPRRPHDPPAKPEPTEEGKERRPVKQEPRTTPCPSPAPCPSPSPLPPPPPPPAQPRFNSEIDLSTDTDDSASDTNTINHDNAVGSVVEQVAAVLDALSDAKEATRQRVIGLVERLAVRLDRVEAENRRLADDNVRLRQQIDRIDRFKSEAEHPESAAAAAEAGPPRSSPVSVITSPPSLTPPTVIKTEPQ